jgi:uncharacterized protein YndB with AHSA1/START domain
MPREFEIRKGVRLDATPDQVWEAIATGHGNAAWFMPAEDMRPDGPGVTAWNPPEHLAVTVSDDDSTQAFEYVIEARDGGTAVLRFVHSGIVGDDWTNEYMFSAGWDMYLHTLAQYFIHFPGRTATFVSAEAPQGSAGEQAWPALLKGLGLADSVAVGDPVRHPLVEGVVDYAGPVHLGVRAADGLYRFHIRTALDMPVAVGHHLYGSVAEPARWQAWLAEIYD